MSEIFYVYIHRRATDGQPFYVGKGQGRRAYSKKDRNKYWHHIDSKHGRTLQFVDTGVSEEQAFELENFLIDFIGRRDKSTGPLVNMTDGGEGHSGYVRTPEFNGSSDQCVEVES